MSIRLQYTCMIALITPDKQSAKKVELSSEFTIKADLITSIPRPLPARVFRYFPTKWPWQSGLGTRNSDV